MGGPSPDLINNERHIQSAEVMETAAESQHQMADGPLSNTTRMAGLRDLSTKTKSESQINPRFEVKNVGRSPRSS